MNKDLNGAETSPYTVNISEILNNDALWRVVKNGYPYKSAAEMGLYSDYDAYVVTKMAIYCILGQSRLDYYSADENDGTAQAMLSILRGLVQEGIYGWETQNSASISANQQGGLVEEGEYYSQTFSVSSSVDLSTYTVSNISNFPEGTYVANSSGGANQVFSYGEIFKIMIPKARLLSDINGEVEIQTRCKSYPIFYGETTVPGTQDYVITYDTYRRL